MTPRISVVTPTLRRPTEVGDLLRNLAGQTLLPKQVILVDGAPGNDTRTEEVVNRLAEDVPFACLYVRHGGGTAIQRNVGIARSTGNLVAFADDDIRLEKAFFETIAKIFNNDSHSKVGGIVGYRTNKFFPLESVQRWRWYRRLRLLKVFEPGRYDFETGYPINANMQSPFSGNREVDFMTTACAVWRQEVFATGLRFDPFFSGYGILEDAHFSLRAGKTWKLLQSGDALCRELSAPSGRENHYSIGYKCAVNYYYVFSDVAGPLSPARLLRFWRFQVFDVFRLLASAIRRHRASDLQEVSGRLRGFLAIASGSAFPPIAMPTSPELEVENRMRNEKDTEVI